MVLSNTSPENMEKMKKQGTSPGPLLFSCPNIPAKNLCPAGHQSDAIPTGASFQHPATYRRGIAWSGTNL